jgi:hypothetical protein
MTKVRIVSVTLRVDDAAQDAELAEWLRNILPLRYDNGQIVAVESLQVRDPDEPLRKAVLVSGTYEPIEIAVDGDSVKLRGRDGSVAVELSALVER